MELAFLERGKCLSTVSFQQQQHSILTLASSFSQRGSRFRA